MDLGRSFTYVFEDEDWLTKIILTAIISMIPIVNFAVMGWVVELIGNMIDDIEHPMPEWDNFGQKFTDGLIYFCAALLYNMVLVGFICMFSVAGSALEAFSEGLALLLFCGMSIFMLVYLLLANVALFIGIIFYTRERNFTPFLQIGTNLRVAMANIGPLIMLFILSTLAGLIMALFGWIPCIGWLLTIGLSVPVYAHLSGQTAAQIYTNAVGEKPKRKNSLV